jgi:hypothetical protein
MSRSAVSRRFVKRTGPALYSLRVGLGGERRRHRRHVSRLDGWRDKRVKPRRRVLQYRSRRRPELARTTRGVSRRRPTSWRARSRGWCRRRGR